MKYGKKYVRYVPISDFNILGANNFRAISRDSFWKMLATLILKFQELRIFVLFVKAVFVVHSHPNF